MEVFVFARLHALPGKQREVHQAMFEVQEPTRMSDMPSCHIPFDSSKPSSRCSITLSKSFWQSNFGRWV